MQDIRSLMEKHRSMYAVDSMPAVSMQSSLEKAPIDAALDMCQALLKRFNAKNEVIINWAFVSQMNIASDAF